MNRLKEQKKSYKTNTEKGITLVALVITVIILIILAGITIAGLTGENGLIKEAKTAKELTELAGLEEQIELAIIKAEQKHRNPTMDDVITELINNKVISDENRVNKETGAVHTDAGYLIEGKLNDYIGKISTGDGNTTGNNLAGGNTSGGEDTPNPPVSSVAIPGEIVTGDENKTYTKNGTAVIPVGFSIVPGLDDVEEGLVISDVANDTANIGNQFVWIPVTDETPYERNTKGFYISRYEADKVCNIYDLEGNAWECIAEKSTYDTNLPILSRGGSYDKSHSASYRIYGNGGASLYVSFRLALYVM